MTRAAALFTILFWATAAPAQSPAQAPDVDAILNSGKLDAGIDELSRFVGQNADNDRARLELGTLRFLRAVERLGQGLHRYGLADRSIWIENMIPILRLPVPDNPNPEELTYEASRQILITFINDLAEAEKTLSNVDDPAVKMPLHVTDIRLNFGSQQDEAVPLQQILTNMRAVRGDRDLFVVFDHGDAIWLRGYCHVLSALCEFVLAHDGQELFDSVAHLFFKKVKSPYPFLQVGRRVFVIAENFDIADMIAMIHLIRMPVKEPERMRASLAHMQEVLKLSGQSWKSILDETDDDHEWLPNPKQKGELGIPVSKEMIDGWLLAADEGSAVLRGEKLVPFWRGDSNQGVNVRRVFTEPTNFDLVLWIQGTAAAPYLEKGTITRPEVWANMQQAFRGNFLPFAVWFN